MNNLPHDLSFDIAINSIESTDGEQAVLGCILTAPEILPDLIDMPLTVDDFYLVKHQYIYAAMLTLQDEKCDIDNLSVIEKLRQQNRLTEVNNGDVHAVSYLTQIMNGTPTHIHYMTYATFVRRCAVRRKWMDAATQIARIAAQNDIAESEINSQVEEVYFNAQAVELESDIVTMSVLASDHFDRTEYRWKHQDVPVGLPTGFTKLDDLLGGGVIPAVYTVAGMTGHGKSAFALGIARNMAEQGIPFAGISLEMPPDQLYHRLVAAEAGIPATKLHRGYMNESDWDRYTNASDRLGRLPIYFTGSQTSGIAEVEAKLRKLARLYGIKAAFVDYLHLMLKGDGKFEVQELGHITRRIKLLQMELNIPIFLLSQFNREAEKIKRRPTKADIRGSGAIAEHSDAVIILWPDPNTEGATKVIVEKNRHGALGDCKLGFYADLVKFYNAEFDNVLAPINLPEAK